MGWRWGYPGVAVPPLYPMLADEMMMVPCRGIAALCTRLCVYYMAATLACTLYYLPALLIHLATPGHCKEETEPAAHATAYTPITAQAAQAGTEPVQLHVPAQCTMPDSALSVVFVTVGTTKFEDLVQ